jgi:choice-of-anchor C domain-containing protein
VKRRSILGIPLALVALVAVTGSALAASPFTNGSFEGGPAANYTTLTPGGSVAIDGWTVTGTDVDWVRNDLWPAKDGSYSVDLNGFGQGGIEQTFATNVNSTYAVQFWMSGNWGDCVTYNTDPAWCSPSNKTLTVSATGTAPASYGFDTAAIQNNGGDMKWQDNLYTFKATSASTTLRFASTTAGAFGPAIDHITVTETVSLTAANCKADGWQAMKDASGVTFKNQGACVSFYAKSGATPIGN